MVSYLLEVHPGELDVDRWQTTLRRARLARADGEARVARTGPVEVRGGQPFAGVSATTLLGAERARLDEERLAAVNEGPRRARRSQRRLPLPPNRLSVGAELIAPAERPRFVRSGLSPGGQPRAPRPN